MPETPAVPLDAVAELERRADDLDSGPRTATSRWTGERLDVDWAIAVLGQRWAPEDVSAETPGVRRRRHPGERRPVAKTPE